MTRFRRRGRWIALAVVLLACTIVQAEDFEKKWRIGIGIGGFDTRDEVKSNSANQLVLTDQDDVPEIFWEDPRNDQAVFGSLQVRSAPYVNFSAQYAVNKIFIVEMAAGYAEADVANIEVQAQFFRDLFPAIERFNFKIFDINAGTMQQIPIYGTMYARFRPKANFNPYLGVGAGYMFVGFEPSDEFNELSRNMDRSVGGFAVLQSFPGSLEAASSVSDLEGAVVEASDAWEWHVTGGVEYTFKRKWAVFADLSWTQYSRSMSIGFNGATSLGKSVPQEREFLDTYTGSTTFGAIDITSGGLIDGGRLVPTDPSQPDEICDTNPNLCEFVPEPDGELDKGFYYAQGGEFRYDRFTLLLGVRYAF